MKSSDNDLELEADNTSKSSKSFEFTNEDIYSDISQDRNKSNDNEESWSKLKVIILKIFRIQFTWQKRHSD